MNKKQVVIFILLCLVASIIILALFSWNKKVDAPIIDQQLPPLTQEKTCELKKYDMDCKIVEFLEKDLAWINNKSAKAFCSYNFLGGDENLFYLKVLCESFYVSNNEFVCPSDKDLNDCFLSKKCESCEKRSIQPRIVLDSGIMVPVKIVKSNNGFVLTKPADGSLYDKSIKEIFPSEIIPKISLTTNEKDLQLINIARSEEHFKAKASFNIDKMLSDECNITSDCPAIPAGYTAKMNCPIKTNCVNAKCAIGCYDFIDHEISPLKK